MMLEIADKVFDLAKGIATEMAEDGRASQSAAMCSQACLYASVMILEAGFGRPPKDDAEEAAIAKRLADFHNELALKMADHAVKHYGVRVASISANGQSLN